MLDDSGYIDVRSHLRQAIVYRYVCRSQCYILNILVSPAGLGSGNRPSS